MAEILLPYPHPGQIAIRQQARRFNWLAAGRRWRKTTMVMSIALEEASQGKRIFWGAPTFDQVRIGWEETRHACGGFGHFNQTNMTVELPRAGRVIYRSLDDPDNARGHTADGIVIDEVQDVRPSAWYEVLQPMLIDTVGWAWLIGTPKGRNWFFAEHVAAADRADSMAWQVPTVGVEIKDGLLVRKPHPFENPDISFEEVKRIWATMSQRAFEEEFLAQFKEGEGAVFRNIAACMGAPKTTPEAHKGHRIVMGVDWAKSQDYTCLSLVCSTCKHEVAHDRFNTVDYVVQRGRLAALALKWGVSEILAESNSIGEPNLEMLRRDADLSRAAVHVTGFDTTAASKPVLIENLVLAFEKTECQWLPDPIWKAELEAYEMKTSANTGRPTYSAPEGVHDDCVMAMALAWHQALKVKRVATSRQG